MKEFELKPCPFCGGEAKLNYFGNNSKIPFYNISCKECGCRKAESIHKEAVINAWNTRKPIDRIVEQLEEIKHDNPMVTDNYILRKDAIDIVRKGGVNE